MSIPPFELIQGKRPLLISMPHNSAFIPPELANRMHSYAQTSPDTDWFLDRLYSFAKDLGASLLKPACSRYVIDLNRPPDNASLYPGQNTTELCPTTCFDLREIYLPGEAPSQTEIQARIQSWWQPYHQALQAEQTRLRQKHPRVLIFEAHSIASEVPRFFEGVLPVFNLGSDNGQSCEPELAQIFADHAEASGEPWVLNGRFKGGYITRAYHRHTAGLLTLQLELSQASYLNEADKSWAPEKAAQTVPVLEKMLGQALDWLERE
jgi:N-formylglutamate deformylase